MAGGKWEVQNKVRPGVYIKFKAKPQPLGNLGDRGIAAYPVSLPWGDPTKVIVLESTEFVEKAVELIGFKATDARIRHIASAVSQASTVLLYRLGGTGAGKATATEGNLTATAKWGGVRGNDLKVVVQANIDEPTHYDIITLLESDELDRQTVATVEELADNNYIVWSGNGEITATAGISLTGGTDGTSSGADFSAALTAFEAYQFNVLGVSLDDTSSKQIAIAYVKRQREEEGKKIQAVLINQPTANYEGIISLHNGIITADGLQVSPSDLVWEIAAMQASANINESLTYSAIPNAVDAFPRLTNSETINALKNGQLVVTALNGTAVIEQDINTLSNFTADRSKAFSKNRVMRILDAIGNDVKRIFEQFYIGKVSNNADGRALLKGEIVSYLVTLQGLGAIQNFDSQTDVSVSAGSDVDAVVVELSVQPVDSIEKIYMTVEVV
ncbi:MAG: phage tail sheath family protein [Candidatus Pristimantibacillus lignocellulolyticus]|uniref:Phage tail sheath family protein n=1 Tax=Candidatus Pristimantibacillus lignocellulolyticus TaxID=2994561 RepID=A0A9J6ZEP9_9BACL|nr:MAG: phage tail sheath family protein [Candidatus Pristimantibacillus lignocellulolyticus]